MDPIAEKSTIEFPRYLTTYIFNPKKEGFPSFTFKKSPITKPTKVLYRAATWHFDSFLTIYPYKKSEDFRDDEILAELPSDATKTFRYLATYIFLNYTREKGFLYYLQQAKGGFEYNTELIWDTYNIKKVT